MAFGGEHDLQRAQGLQHAIKAGVVAHGAYAPDLAGQGAEAGADFDVEVVQQSGAQLVAVDAIGDVHTGDVGHFVADVAVGFEVHALYPGDDCAGCGGVAGVGLGQALLHKNAGAFARAVKHGGGFGVVVQTGVAPVVHDHRHVHVVGCDALASAGYIVCGLQAVFNVAAAVDGAGHLVR